MKEETWIAIEAALRAIIVAFVLYWALVGLGGCAG